MHRGDVPRGPSARDGIPAIAQRASGLGSHPPFGIVEGLGKGGSRRLGLLPIDDLAKRARGAGPDER